MNDLRRNPMWGSVPYEDRRKITEKRRAGGQFGYEQPSLDFNWDRALARFRAMMDEMYR